MLKSLRIDLLLPSFLCISACSVSMKVTKVDPGSAPSPMEVAYSLPFQQFDFTATRAYKGCVDNATRPSMELKVSATPVSYVPVATSTGTTSTGTASTTTTPTPVPSPDPAQTYSIDPMSLDSWSKISDLKINYVVTNGATTLLLSSVNAAAEDRTAQIITNTLTAAASIATTVASGGVGGADKVKCVPDPVLQKALDAQPPLDARVKAATSVLDKATARLKVITTLAGSPGTRLDNTTSALMISATEAVKAATDIQTAATKAAAENQKKFTITTIFRWPVTGALDEDGAQQVAVPGGADAAAQFRLAAVLPGAAKNFGASVRLEQVPNGLQSPARASTTTTELKGLRYRTPMPARLVACRDTHAGADAGDAPVETFSDKTPACGQVQAQANVIMSDGATPIWTGMAGQLGQVKALDYSNGVFQNNSLSVSFNADGGLSAVEYAAKAARGETATGALASGVGAIATGLKGVKQGQIDQINNQASLAQAKINLVTQQSNLSTAEQVGVIQANTNLVKAQSAYEDAQTTLIKSTASLKAAQTSP